LNKEAARTLFAITRQLTSMRDLRATVYRVISAGKELILETIIANNNKLVEFSHL